MTDKPKTLKQLLRTLISEAVDDAKAGRASVPAPTQQMATSPTDVPQATQQPDANPDAAGAAEKDEKLASGDIETKDVISKLNLIRAGRSFKDSAVADPMTAYVDKLDGAEKTALYAFLSGIAQIVTGESVPGTVTDPSDQPADVQMTKKATDPAQAGQERVLKPNVKQAAAAPAPKGRENTTAPRPVVPRAR